MQHELQNGLWANENKLSYPFSTFSRGSFLAIKGVLVGVGALIGMYMLSLKNVAILCIILSSSLSGNLT